MAGRVGLRQRTFYLRTIWALGVATAMATATGCNDSANEGRVVSTARSEPELRQPDVDDPSGVGNKGAIKEVLTDVQADFPFQIGTSVCAVLSDVGRRELERSGAHRSGECDKAAAALARRNRAGGIAPRYSRILSVDYANGVGVAVVRDGDGRPYRVPFVKGRGTDGGWSLVSLAFAEPVGYALRPHR